MYKIVAADLDGTLLQTQYGKKLRPDIFPAIHEYTSAGGVFLPASGRQYANLRNLFAPVQDEIAYICENGCLVFYQDELIYKSVMNRELAIELIRAMEKIDGCEILVSGVNTCYVRPKDHSFYTYIAEHVKNITALIDDLEAVPEDYFKISCYSPRGTGYFEDILKEQFGDILNVVTSGNCWLDVMPKGVHKGAAMAVLCEKLGIASEDAVALGDHYNDLEILELVGHPACVDNAQPEIKEMCEMQMECGSDLLLHYLKG